MLPAGPGSGVPANIQEAVLGPGAGRGLRPQLGRWAANQCIARPRLSGEAAGFPLRGLRKPVFTEAPTGFCSFLLRTFAVLD